MSQPNNQMKQNRVPNEQSGDALVNRKALDRRCRVLAAHRFALWALRFWLPALLIHDDRRATCHQARPIRNLRLTRPSNLKLARWIRLQLKLSKSPLDQSLV